MPPDRLDAAVHAALGVAMLVRPDALLGRIAGRTTDRRARIAARVLGGRHLAEALWFEARPPGWAAVAATVDGLHAASMVALAAARRDRRPLGLAVAALAAGLAGVEARDARRQPEAG